MKAKKLNKKFNVPRIDVNLFKKAVKLAEQLLGHQFCNEKGSILHQYNQLIGTAHNLADFDAEMSAEDFVSIDLLPNAVFSFEITEAEFIKMIEVLKLEDDDIVYATWLEKILTAHHSGFKDIYNRFEYEKFPNNGAEIYNHIISKK